MSKQPAFPGLRDAMKKKQTRRELFLAGLFSAAEVGAPDQRMRIFILAHTDEPASRHG